MVGVMSRSYFEKAASTLSRTRLERFMVLPMSCGCQWAEAEDPRLDRFEIDSWERRSGVGEAVVCGMPHRTHSRVHVLPAIHPVREGRHR